jgi:hypothetical protein
MIEDALEYAWSNSAYKHYHEVGHMFVDQFDTPVLSKEEDAADNLATLMVLEDYTENGNRILEDAATYWALSGAWESETGDSDFYDEHSLDQQRAYAMVCLLVGSDKETFGETAADWGLDENRQESCYFDYEQARASWDKVLEPHLHESNAEPMIEVVYHEPKEGFEDVAGYMQENRVLETVAERVEAQYMLPNPVTFRAGMCGQDNAFYSASRAEVMLCYEHPQGHFETYLVNLVEDWSAYEGSDNEDGS